ncbi:hypothetical protein UlMin_032325 [Ulmus minor]
MGICSSSQYHSNKAKSLTSSSFIHIINLDGSLRELRPPIKASQVLFQNPNSFLCSSESMHVDKHVPRVSKDEDLNSDQIYFFMPLSQSKSLLSLQGLCALAIKANTALSQRSSKKIGSQSNSCIFQGPCCKFPTGFDIVRVN